MMIKRILIKIKKALDTILLKGKVSYAQSGEDLIANYFFESIGISNPSYIDIGSNQPIKGNNTYYFYLKGSKGICIEPDVTIIPTLKNKRPNDIILNIGISVEDVKDADFFYFDGHYNAWNTFSKTDADIKKKESGIYYHTTKVNLENIHNVINEHNFNHVNYISIDVEGLDLEILKSINFEIIRPELICVETIIFSLGNGNNKNDAITDYMLSQNYIVYADTNLNTFYCRKDLFL